MAGFLNKIFSNKSNGSAVGVDIGTSSIKAVHLKNTKGSAEILNYGSISLGPYAGIDIGRATNLSTDKIALAIKDLFGEMSRASNSEKVNSTKLNQLIRSNSNFSIPLNSSLLSVIEMPSMSQKELENAIPLEARKYIPVPMAEVILNWSIIPNESDVAEMEKEEKREKEDKKTSQKPPTAVKPTEVLVAAIHKEIVRKHEDIKNKVGMAGALFEIEMFSTIRSSIGRDMSPLMIIDLGAGTTKIAMIEYGVVKRSHIINTGSQDITIALAKVLDVPVAKAEEIKREFGLDGKIEERNLRQIISLPLDNIFSEAHSVLSAYNRKYNKNVEKAILTGGGAALKGITAVAKDGLGINAVTSSAMAKMEAPAFLESTLKEASPEFSVAAGLALKGLEE